MHSEIGGRDDEALTTFCGKLSGWEPGAADPGYRLVTAGDGVGEALLRCGGDLAPHVPPDSS